MVIDNSAHFGVWRVLSQNGHNGSRENQEQLTDNNHQGSLDLELLVNPLVLDWVTFQSLVVFVAVCGFQNARREVRVLSVLSIESILPKVTAR